MKKGFRTIVLILTILLPIFLLQKNEVNAADKKNTLDTAGTVSVPYRISTASKANRKIVDDELVLDERLIKCLDLFDTPDYLIENYLYEDITKVLKDMESIDINALSKKYKNIKITTKGINLYFDKDGNLIKDLRDEIEYDKYIYVVNKKKYIVTVYGFDIVNEAIYYTPIVTFPCAINESNTRVGKFLTTSTFDWHMMINGEWARYCVRFDGNRLFHSALFKEYSNDSLDISSYNGINRKWNSGGCVRLRTGDAYYLYKINKYHTLVVVHESDKDFPFGRESFEELRWVPMYASESELYQKRYDPTDPELN